MKYLALTIGPIYKTLANAKKPKELFTGSYIFSYIMRSIIERFKERSFVIPYIKEKTVFDSNSRVGLFHDRFIFESEDGDLEKLQGVIAEVLTDVAKNLNVDFEETKSYFQIHYLEKELAKDANPILELTPYLDSAELFFEVAKNDNFLNTLRRKKGDKDNFLTQDKEIIHDLKELTHNKYYTIVHADGDKMGEAIKDPSKIEDVSRALFGYCMQSNKLIDSYGGQTIFAGGDDLMFIAPTISRNGKQTIFNLCDEISELFDTALTPATLSFGISINYIKYPLYEAVEHSREQLFHKAKKEPKNSIAFTLSKHSGQSFETVVCKDNRAVYEAFLNLTSNITQTREGTQNFLHSIHHKIDTHKVTIEQIMGNKERLKNFFDNYFNKDIHKEYGEFFNTLINFIYISQDIDLTYAALRFVKFIQGDKQ